MSRTLFLVAVALLVASPARPDDWPALGGSPSRNMANPAARRLPTAFHPNRDALWKADLGSRAQTQPVVAGDVVLVGTNNARPRNPRDTFHNSDGEVEPLDRAVLLCLDRATGAFRWQALFDPPAVAGVAPLPRLGLTSTPAVDGSRAYVLTPAAVVVCLDLAGFADGNQGDQAEKYRGPTDADVLWSFDLRRELGVFPHWPAGSSPLIVGGRVFVVTGNGVDDGHVNAPAPEAPSFVALDALTGRLLWKDASPGRDILHGQWASPAYAADPVPQVIFPGGDGWVRAFDPPTGRLLWAFDGNPKDAKYALDGSGTRLDFLAAPVVVGTRLYLAHGADPELEPGPGRLWCLDLAKAVTGGAARSDRDVTAAAAVWCHADSGFGRSTATACVVGDVLYLADTPGALHCLDARTGRRHWRHDTGSGIRGSAFVADGRVYVGTDAGELWVWRHAAGAKELLARVTFPDPIRAAPSAAGGVLYVATERTLYAIGRRE